MGMLQATLGWNCPGGEEGRFFFHCWMLFYCCVCSFSGYELHLPHFPKFPGYKLSHFQSIQRNNLLDIAVIVKAILILSLLSPKIYFAFTFYDKNIYHFLWNCSSPLLQPYPSLPSSSFHLSANPNCLVSLTLHNRQWFTSLLIKISFLAFLWACESLISCKYYQ